VTARGSRRRAVDAIAVLVLVVATTGACGSSRPGDCSVTCGPGASCPSGNVCGSDGYCHEGDSVDPSALCGGDLDDGGAPIADADPDDPDADPSRPDADPARPDAAPGSPDAAAPVDCNIYFQTGCPDGQACELDYEGTFCRDIGPPGPDGELCDTLEECAAGDTCEGTTGICRRYCEDGGDCNDGPGDTCTIELETGAFVCTTDCQPVTNDGCPPGWGCILLHEAGTTFSDCIPGGRGTEGDACEPDYFLCAPGFDCYDDFAGGYQCDRLCRIGADDCPGAYECETFAVPVVLDGVEYGVCTP
jgi:hypothetical protein